MYDFTTHTLEHYTNIPQLKIAHSSMSKVQTGNKAKWLGAYLTCCNHSKEASNLFCTETILEKTTNTNSLHTVLIPGTACNILCRFNGLVSSTNWVSYGRSPGAWLFTCFGRSTLIGSDPLTTSCWDNRVGPALLTYSTTLPHTAGLVRSINIKNT